MVPASELADADPAALVTRLENRLRRLEERKATTIADAEHARREIEHATGGLGKPFPQDVDLHTARERVRAIDTELERMAEAARAPSEAAAEEAQGDARHPTAKRTASAGRAAESSIDRGEHGMSREALGADLEAGQ